MTCTNDFFNGRFEHIWFKGVFNLKLMDFENITLTKVVHIFMTKGLNVYNIQ
jgi:hypothetical protein